MGGLSPGAMLDLPNHQPNQFLKPKFPTSPSLCISFEVRFFCWSTQKQFSTTSMGMSWKFAAGKRLATQMGRVCPGCTNYEPLKFPGLAKILHGICSESWDPPKNNIIRMEQDIPKGKIRWAFVLHEYSQGFRGCLAPPRSMGFPRSSCPCQLGVVDGIDGEDHDDEQAYKLQEESQANHVLLIFDVYKMWSTSVCFFARISEDDSFFFKRGMVLTLDEFCGQCNSHPWNPWATQWVLSTTGECFQCRIGLVIPCYLKKRLFVKMLAYGPTAPRKEGALLLAFLFQMHLK